MEQMAISNLSVWSLLRSDYSEEVSAIIAGSMPKDKIGYSHRNAYIQEALITLKYALLTTKKVAICFGDDQTNQLIKFICNNSNLREKEVESAFLYTSKILPDMAENRGNHPNYHVVNFFHNNPDLISTLYQDPDHWHLTIDYYQDAREGAVFSRLHTLYLGHKLNIPYFSSRDEKADFSYVQFKRSIEDDPRSNRFLQDYQNILVPRMSELSFDDVFLLRKNAFWDSYRSFVDKLYRRGITAEEAKIVIESEISEFLKLSRPNIKQTSILNVSAAAPLGPINPVGVVTGMNAIENSLEIRKKYGWIWFSFDVEAML